MRADRLAGVLLAPGQFCVPVWSHLVACVGLGGAGLAHLHYLGPVLGHLPLQRLAGHGGGGACHADLRCGLCGGVHLHRRARGVANGGHHPAHFAVGTGGRLARRRPGVAGGPVPPAATQGGFAPGPDLRRGQRRAATGLGHGQQPRNARGGLP